MKELTSDDYERAETERLLDEGWTTSRFRGRCVKCGHRFAEGTLIRRPDNTLGWIAVCCQSTTDDDEGTL